MSAANQKQVGGNHYKHGGEEHWDRVNRLGLNYFQGAATKYVERCYLKGNPIQDLQRSRPSGLAVGMDTPHWKACAEPCARRQVGTGCDTSIEELMASMGVRFNSCLLVVAWLPDNPTHLARDLRHPWNELIGPQTAFFPLPGAPSLTTTDAACPALAPPRSLRQPLLA
jgi:hypothetical protein